MSFLRSTQVSHELKKTYGLPARLHLPHRRLHHAALGAVYASSLLCLSLAFKIPFRGSRERNTLGNRKCSSPIMHGVMTGTEGRVDEDCIRNPRRGKVSAPTTASSKGVQPEEHIMENQIQTVSVHSSLEGTLLTIDDGDGGLCLVWLAADVAGCSGVSCWDMKMDRKPAIELTI